MLDASVAHPAVPGDKEDDSSGVTSSSVGAPPATAVAAAHKQEKGISGAGSGDGVGRNAKRKDRRRSRSIRGFFGRTKSYLTIMTTWILFRFLLKGLNRVSEWVGAFELFLVSVSPRPCAMDLRGGNLREV